jgi:uridine kinase
VGRVEDNGSPVDGSGAWADEVVARVIDLRESLGRSVSVGISGVDCAGKSTLAESVRARLQTRGASALLVPGDEFTRPTAERYAEADEGLGYYRSFDYADLFDRILPAVRCDFAGELVIKVSDWERDDWRTDTLVLARATVVIVEGCFLFASGRACEFDLSVWIDLPLESVVSRALRRPRDLERMGGSSGVNERYARRYLPGQTIHLERDSPAQSAGLVLRSNA